MKQKNIELEREKQSEIDKKLLLIRELTWIDQLDKVPGNREIIGEYKRDIEVEVTVKAHEENYEQLALPGCETEQGEVRKVKKKVSVGLFRGNKYYRKVKPERTMNEILTDHSKHSLSDYNKYFGAGLSAKSSKEMLANGVAEWITEHPLQLLLTLSKSAIRLLRKLADMEEGNSISITEKKIDDYMLMIIWGLLDVGIMYQDEEIFFGLSIPIAVKEKILPQLENITIEGMRQSDICCYFASNEKKVLNEKELWDGINGLGDDIHLVLAQYGVLDAKTFHRLFTEICQSELTEKQLMRFVYLWGTFRQRLRTGKLVTGKDIFIGNPEIAIDLVILNREKYCKDIPYKFQPRNELLTALSSIMQLWAVVGASFEEWEYDREEMEGIILGGNCLIQESSAA